MKLRTEFNSVTAYNVENKRQPTFENKFSKRLVPENN